MNLTQKDLATKHALYSKFEQFMLIIAYGVGAKSVKPDSFVSRHAPDYFLIKYWCNHTESC